ncbi:hypothetical protein E2C01_011091 [Portunus trituberculatus]|uniref:Uncharacterized protein n=1 Tax=Portunus trituberculatus TaxID=210409 RepID=A0A5B7DAG7_PORTR|nr:hypothetical protein [Portunus trituberculatus]
MSQPTFTLGDLRAAVDRVCFVHNSVPSISWWLWKTLPITLRTERDKKETRGLRDKVMGQGLGCTAKVDDQLVLINLCHLAVSVQGSFIMTVTYSQLPWRTQYKDDNDEFRKQR